MRVLIINVIIMGDKNATGTTMKNMLYGMPGIEWLQLCTEGQPEKHQELVMTEYLPLNCMPEEQLRKLLSVKKKTVAHLQVQQTGIVSARPRTKIKDIIHGCFHSIPIQLPKALDKRIRDFNPDLIYTMGSDFRDINLSIKYAKELNIPIVFHCMDDIRSTIYTSSAIAKVFNRYFKHRLQKMHRYTVYNMGIGEKMASYYAQQYKTPYSYASNCILQYADETYQRKKDQPIRIIFSGGLHFHRGDRLLEVAEVVEKLNQQELYYELSVFAPKNQVAQYAQRFALYSHTKIREYVPENQQLDNLASADILIHVESTDPTDMQYMKYSFSTKLVEYCAAGRTIIGYGDPSMSSIAYIAEKQIGDAANSPEELEAVLVEMSQPGRLEYYAQNAVNVGHREHAQKAVQARIMSVFHAATSKQK